MASQGDPRTRLPVGPTLNASTGRLTFVCDAADFERGARPRYVWFHLSDYGADTSFRKVGQQWVASFDKPPAHRLEYLLDIETASGHSALVPDPNCPRAVKTVFGSHSILEFPGYSAPGWLTGRDPDTRKQPIAVSDAETDVDITGVLHTPEGLSPRAELPLLVVHDGPEYAELASLLTYLGAIWADDPRLHCRVLLLQPHNRNRSYSASPAYARLFAEKLLPSVRRLGPSRGPVIGVGASLGGLAMLHIALRHPGTLGGVFSQSGSFFRVISDPQEHGFRFFGRIADFVTSVTRWPAGTLPLDVALTCGTAEENLANNRLMATTLRQAGASVMWADNPDGHNYINWRDSLHPTLGNLMAKLWL